MAKKLKKRADGRYAKQFTIGMRDGKPVKKTVYGRTIQEVEKKHRDFLSLYERGIILEETNITLSEFMHKWYTLKKKDYIQPNTKASYRSRFKRIDQSIGAMRLKEIRPYTVEYFLNDIIKEGNPSTAKLILILLKNVFDYAVSIDLLLKNPCHGIHVPYRPKQKRILSDTEKIQIENRPLTPRDRALIYLLRYTGMRRGEVLALTTNDIDFDNRIIKINKTLIDQGGRGAISHHTKTAAGNRNMPILNPLVLPLQDYLATLPDDQQYLFLNQNGKLYTANGGYWLMRHIRSVAGLAEDVTFHTFRHTFITECYQAGVSLKKLQLWVGHTDIQTTLNIYTHLEGQILYDCEEINQYYENCNSQIS